jgi:hypothetical protein
VDLQENHGGHRPPLQRTAGFAEVSDFRQSKRPLPTNPKRGLAEEGNVEQVGLRRLSAAFPSVMAS